MRSIKNENIFCICIIAFLFFDLGNVDAIRQGTEGFYLLISKEMYLKGSFLTPMIYDAPHWSKPPLHFWLPMPLYKVFGEYFLLLGRLSVLLLSLLCTFLISQIYERELKRNWIEAFFFLTTPLYFIKYSRIYMMELPLTYLSVLGSLYFYSYLSRSKRKFLFLSIIFSALSILIKGPVSLLMIFPACFIFALSNKKKGIIRFTIFSVSTSMVASIWFLLSFWKYGHDFIHYFFIRENLGKFTAKNYPMRSVIQGLLIYSFPTNLLVISLFKRRKDLKLNQFTLFLLLNFIFYFILWLIPKQKSHHYAVPSIPFLCLLISYYFFSLKNHYRLKALSLLEGFYKAIILVSVTLGIFIIYFKEFLSFTGSQTYLSGAVACLALWSYLRKKPINRAYLMSFLLPFILLWQFILPLAFLPIAPAHVTQKLHSRPKAQFFVSHRKPFFIFEATKTNGLIISSAFLKDPRIKSDDFVFTSADSLSAISLHLLGFNQISEWYSWKRGVGLKEVLEALKLRDLRLIQSKYLLLQKFKNK